MINVNKWQISNYFYDRTIRGVVFFFFIFSLIHFFNHFLGDDVFLSKCKKFHKNVRIKYIFNLVENIHEKENPLFLVYFFQWIVTINQTEKICTTKKNEAPIHSWNSSKFEITITAAKKKMKLFRKMKPHIFPNIKRIIGFSLDFFF